MEPIHLFLSQVKAVRKKNILLKNKDAQQLVVYRYFFLKHQACLIRDPPIMPNSGEEGECVRK